MPGIVVVKLDTFPGFVAPLGTVHAYVYVPDGVAVAVTVALFPVHAVGLLTKTLGGVQQANVQEYGFEDVVKEQVAAVAEVCSNVEEKETLKLPVQ